MFDKGSYLRFPGGKRRALTLSYDDATDQDFRLVELLKKYNVKATFNVSSGWLAKEGTEYPEGEVHRRMTEKQCIECYDPEVCEIAAHGYTHPWSCTLPTPMQMEQVLKDREKLEEMFGTIVTGMAYPYGMHDESLREILKYAGIKYCRTVHSTHGFDIPTDWLQLPATCHHDDPELFNLLDQFLGEARNDLSKLFYLWGHTFEFERNNNWDRMEEFLEKASGRDEIWYATNGEIYDYVNAYNQLVFSLNGKHIKNPTATDIWLEIDGVMITIKAGTEVRL